MDVHAYATSPTTFMRRTPMLMNSCVLWQLVKGTFTVSLYIHGTNVKQLSLESDK